jgi:hypothetical protein
MVCRKRRLPRCWTLNSFAGLEFSVSPMIVVSIALLASSPALKTEPTITPTEMLIRLNVQPMAAPKPALRYLLLPELKEMTPGNPIEGYLKCFMDKKYSEQMNGLTGLSLRQADRAARMDKPDWQILLKARTDGVGLLLPDLQGLRFLASSLQERFRLELLRGHFDEALVTAKTMFALSRHLGEHPTLIGNLVGIAIAQVAIAPLEEMLEQPGCPNLYWALTNLPNPLISFERGMEGERIMSQAELHDLDDSVPMSSAQLKKLLERIDQLRDLEDKPRKEKTQAWLDERTKDQVLLKAAFARLVDYGIPEERLKNFPAAQLVLLDEKREYETLRDEDAKLMNLPTWQVEELSKGLVVEKPTALFRVLLSSLQKIRRAQGRLEQRIALLRHVEALRLHAVEHKGQLPEKLGDITVPLPADPFTGKPFRYKLEGATAHLRGSPPSGLENMAEYNLHYEITLKR